MKDILIDGHRLLTTDAIADAVLDYASLLHRDGRTDVVDFPSIHDGELSRCSLLLGTCGAVAVVEAGGLPSSSLPEADQAREEIARRADRIRESR